MCSLSARIEPEALVDPLTALEDRIREYLDDLELTPERPEGGLFLFRHDSTVIAVSAIDAGRDRFVRFVGIAVEDVKANLELLQKVLEVNAQVLMGSFLLFEDDTLCFSVTLPAAGVSLDVFDTTLRYVATTSARYDAMFRHLAGGRTGAELVS